MSRILVVDDEPAIQRLLQAVLERGGHAVLPATNARDAAALLGRGGIDAVLLDLGLPDRDGIELVGAIRAGSAIPIIVLTARSETSEKIAALDLGADDYVTKPFDGDELLARLRAALRRADRSAPVGDTIAFGPLKIDRARREVTVEGTPVTLTPKEFAVLETLTEAGGRVLTHAAILERVWGKAHAEDVDYLRVVIRALRLKVESDPSSPRLIRNEPAIGYRLAEIP
ncbi:Fis family transcriptional regulator [Erythrobacter sp. SG61-1L]|uniref:response regulator transcription factor n=1 Tax=Erythrobacter sp. SG61-1L TaxID=1603897 RepID=UPI0006C92D8E|nr:response regulator transcription factor [Erythrobacter sp. SG61-1L]KPL68582.1 Fis family transcriptional regulator [Erythrobacter sp. SG61-1L]